MFCFSADAFESFPNETALENRMMDDGSNKTKNVMLAGIVFDATNLTEKFPKDLKVRKMMMMIPLPYFLFM